MDHCQFFSVQRHMWNSGSKLVAPLHQMHQRAKKREEEETCF